LDLGAENRKYQTCLRRSGYAQAGKSQSPISKSQMFCLKQKFFIIGICLLEIYLFQFIWVRLKHFYTFHISFRRCLALAFLPDIPLRQYSFILFSRGFTPGLGIEAFVPPLKLRRHADRLKKTKPYAHILIMVQQFRLFNPKISIYQSLLV